MWYTAKIQHEKNEKKNENDHADNHQKRGSSSTFQLLFKKKHVCLMAVAPLRRSGPRTTIAIVGDPNQGEDIRVA